MRLPRCRPRSCELEFGNEKLHRVLRDDLSFLADEKTDFNASPGPEGCDLIFRTGATNRRTGDQDT